MLKRKQQEVQMKFKIAVKKALEVAEKNLQEHITELNEATKGWTEKVKTALDALRDAVNRDGVKTENVALQHLFYSKPIDNRANYSRFIGALKLAAENGQENIELDEDEYDHLFNDNWDWRVPSKASNAAYTGKPR